MVQRALSSAAHPVSRGFSLVELIVVTAIFVLLTAVVLSNNSRFGERIVLQNLAHDIALSIREAQVYGIAVRKYGTNQYNVGYGMHFALGNAYELYADANANGIWDPGETVKATTITNGYRISEICAPSGTCGMARMDILFKRPEPDACISINGAVSLDANRTCISGVARGTVEVSSARDDGATIFIETSGQISVQ